jgi:putative hydrolase of the HAD superfamily
MTAQAVDALLLDLGNVFVFHDNALLYRRLGARAGLSGEEVGRRFAERVWPPIVTAPRDEAAIRNEVCLALGIRLEAAEFHRLFTSHFTLHDELVPAVERLIGRVRLGILSNTNAAHARWCREHIPVLDRFDAVLLSHEVGLAKPDPAFYRAALSRLGTEPGRTLFFDDLPEYVQAARAMGMRAEVFTTAEAFADSLAAAGLG